MMVLARRAVTDRLSADVPELEGFAAHFRAGLSAKDRAIYADFDVMVRREYAELCADYKREMDSRRAERSAKAEAHSDG